MAKIGIDFSQYSSGTNLLAQGWQQAFHATSDVSFTVVADPSADGGKAARLSKTTAGGYARDSIQWINGGQKQNGSAFFRWKVPADNNPSNFSEHQGPGVRISGGGSNETGFLLYASQQDDEVAIGWYDDASFSTASSKALTWAANQWLNILVTFDQTSTTYKVWTGDRVTDEGNAVSITTTSGPKVTGYLGMTIFREESEYYLDFLGFADPGEAAPRSMSDISGTDVIAPNVTVNALTTSDTTPTVTGTCDDPTATLELIVDGVTYNPATPASAGGTWSQTLNTLALDSYEMVIKGTDAESNEGTSSATLTVVAEVVETSFATGFQDGNNFDPNNSTVSGAATSTPTVTIVPRTGPGSFYHVLARIDGVGGKTPTFVLDCSNYVGGTVGDQWRPWYTTTDPNLHTTEWTRWPYDATNLDSTTKEFALPSAFSADTVWIGFQIGYPVSRTTSLINWLTTNHSALIKELPSSGADHIITTFPPFTDELGRTVPEQPLYGFKIRENSTAPADGDPKRKIVILGGTHAGEHMGDFTMEGFLKWLVGGSIQANALLRNFEFLVYPLLNPRGRAAGYRRAPPGESDINRNLDDSPTGTEVVAITNAWNMDIGGRSAGAKIDMMFTWHGSYYTGEESSIHFFYQAAAEAGYASAFETILDGYQPTRFQSLTPDGVADQYFRLYYDTQHAYTVESAERHDVIDANEYTQAGINVGLSINDVWDQYPSHFVYTGILPASINLGVSSSDVWAISCQSAATLSIAAVSSDSFGGIAQVNTSIIAAAQATESTGDQPDAVGTLTQSATGNDTLDAFANAAAALSAGAAAGESWTVQAQVVVNLLEQGITSDHIKRQTEDAINAAMAEQSAASDQFVASINAISILTDTATANDAYLAVVGQLGSIASGAIASDSFGLTFGKALALQSGALSSDAWLLMVTMSAALSEVCTADDLLHAKASVTTRVTAGASATARFAIVNAGIQYLVMGSIILRDALNYRITFKP